MENPVIIFGAGGLGKLALDAFSAADITVYCFLDDDETLHDALIGEITVMGRTDDDGYLKFIGKKCEAFVALDDYEDRQAAVKLLNERRKVMPVNCVHPQAYISELAVMGHGNLLAAGCSVGPSAEIGQHCVVRPGATVEHDAKLANHAQIGAGSVVGANVQIGEGAFVGAGVTLAAGVKVGKEARVAPGSVVLQDVEEGQTVFGVPAKPVG